MKPVRPISIAIFALGGQGGGVLAGWIIALAEAQGYIAQSTSVPGVAQRTGATIYYVELFPKDAAIKAKRAPVLALMPVPGDVDIVIASEIMEAGRAMLRGFVSNRTTLITSTHRVYAISEKEPLGDGRRDPVAIQELAKDTAGRCIAFDMEAAANTTQSFISAVLFGALAGSEALPFSRKSFEKVIGGGKKAENANQMGFVAGHNSAGRSAALVPASKTQPAINAAPAAPVVLPLLERLEQNFSASCQAMILMGLKKVVDYQDPRYGSLYLDRMMVIHTLDRRHDGSRKAWRLSQAVARYLALAMSFEDTVRVAELKTRADRFANFAAEVGATDNQIIRITEYMHPRVQEFCDILPAPLGRFILRSNRIKSMLGVFFGKGRHIRTTSLRGFVLLRLIANLKPLRRASLRFAAETDRIEQWLDLVTRTAPINYALACEIAGLQRLIKGYGDTHERGIAHYTTLIGALKTFKTDPKAHTHLKTLKHAALADEEGLALQKALEKLQNGRTP
jgi:indolepyruvate ferredoxin oxidoreductase, beta subunit